MNTFIRLVGALLILLGIGGLILGNEPLFGRLNIDMSEDIVHIITGLILLIAGAKTGAVAALGIIYLLVGILGFVSPTMYGFIPSGYSSTDNLIHVVLGILLLAISFTIPRRVTI